jgi:hypothetical protein
MNVVVTICYIDVLNPLVKGLHHFDYTVQELHREEAPAPSKHAQKKYQLFNS